MFALADWSNELIESYSHGMKQRLIMASAVLHDPEVLIVDEPMVGFDPLAIIMVKKLFRKLAADGVTIFMLTRTRCRSPKTSATASASSPRAG